MARAAKVCTTPGCPNLRPCTEHTPAPWATSTRRQHTSSGWRQQAEARLVMKRDHGICHICHQPGADQVDHIIELADGGADDMTNKAPIHSKPCHVAKTAAASTRARQTR